MSALVIHRPRWQLVPLVLGCCAAAFWGSWLLWKDLHSDGGAVAGPSVASVERLSHGVRRKPRGSFLWNPLSESAELYEKDTVQAGPNSAATLRLKDGTLLEMGENSLVQLEDVSQLSLGFLQGSFIIRKHSEDLAIEVDSKGGIKSQKLPLRLLAPAPRDTRVVGSPRENAVTFEWKLLEKLPGTALRLEIATSTDFLKKSTQTFPVKEGMSAMILPLPTGDFFWRIKADSKSASESRRLELRLAPTLIPLFPNADSVLSTWKEKSPVSFSWTGPEGGEAIQEKTRNHVQISKDPSFSNLVQSLEVSRQARTARVEGIAPGTYYWRLSSEFSDFNLFSKALPFEVRSADRLVPQLLFPKNGGFPFSLGGNSTIPKPATVWK
jgi:hypothetical protein